MSEAMFEDHEMVKRGVVEARSYQAKIAASCLRGNTLVCLPTGLGKTVIAALVAAERLKRYPGKKVVMLSPTRPLVLQHLETFRRILKLPPEELDAVTGYVPPSEREAAWRRRVIFSTPQVLSNDILASRVNLEDVSLMIFDEAHRGVGDYAYTFIAERYASTTDPLILGLTASPGCSRQDIEATMRNLYIRYVEARTAASRDVKPYLSGIRVEWVRVPLPDKFLQVKKLLNYFIEQELRRLHDVGMLQGVTTENLKLRTILELTESFRKSGLGTPTGDVKRAVIGAYATIHALKILELLETQGPEASKDYLNGLRERVKARSTASARLFLGDRNVAEAAKLVDELIDSGTGHPKMPELVRLVKESLSRGSRRIIIFTNYRSTASKLADLLNSSGAGVSAARLVGHASRADDRGLSEKAQTLILDDFKNGSFNVLIATQVGEEGLDIAECDHVIFYDTVPSAIRYIQRRGRTGRRGPGRATILIAQGTRDEAYYWISRRREKMMAEALDEISRTERGQPPLEEFMRPTPQRAVDEANVRIIVDTREGPSQVVKELSRLGVKLELKPLLYGDYVLSDRVTVERKTSEDLASSIIDGRLFEQASNLKASYERPILLIEGETLYTSRNIRPEAVIGAVASLLADYGLPVVWSTSPAETALLLSSIARREQTGAARQPRIRGEKPYTSPSRLQEYIVAGLPQVDMTLARRLLKRFRTVEGVFTASAGELKEVEGIGEKKSEKIREALTREYDGG